jgi:hypothetical protein
VVLRVELENYVQYCGNVSDYSKLASDANRVPCSLRTFGKVIALADVVAVNGRPAKGTLNFSAYSTNVRTAPTPGQATGDAIRNGPVFETLELLHPDGTPIGTLVDVGMAGGSAPPGSPSELTGGNFAIVGGTGAFLGARGQRGAGGSQMMPTRNASMAEDPVNRRSHGGGKMTWIWWVIPMSWPEIKATATGPAIVHSRDFTLVSTASPAKEGEILSLFATGLGPVRGPFELGKPFPASPLAVVNSPVDVLVNGMAADVLAAVGYPGSTDAYQVNFRVPAGVSRGTASIEVIVAWIPGTPISIPIQ